ncbi:carboxymuconolactone decarboxylase [Actinobacillus equuli]|nr:carboxymuconolactone decarboxylase [Actinobacillus equuli]
MIQTGDVINIPENIEHWHGANADSDLVHLAITNYKDGKKSLGYHQSPTKNTHKCIRLDKPFFVLTSYEPYGVN